MTAESRPPAATRMREYPKAWVRTLGGTIKAMSVR